MVSITNDTETQKIWEILETVPDPEIPVLSVLDLGIVRDVRLRDGQPEVFITPTYSGCPAMDMIAMQIKLTLAEKGFTKTVITPVLSPAWTTDWMTESGKEKLRRYGIAPPHARADDTEQLPVACPQCGSTDTKLLSQFGSTSCKALYQCNDCREPFDHFKCH